MDAFPKIPEVIGIGFVVIAFLWVALQIIKILVPGIQKKTAEEKGTMIDVISRNATAMEKLSKSVEENTAATKAGAEAIKVGQQREDLFTRMLVEVMRTSGRTPESTMQSAPTTTHQNNGHDHT